MSEIDAAQTGALAAPAQNSAPAEQSQVQGSESATEQVEAQPQEKPRDEKGRYVPQERVNEITRARREAERERDFYRQQLEQFQRQPPAQQAPQDIPDPSAYDFDMQKWGSDLASRVQQTAFEQAQQQFHQAQRQAYEQQLIQSFASKESEYAAANPDYWEGVSALNSVANFGPDVGEILATSDHGPAVLHYLSQHLDEADRISRLPPHIAAAQIGRIEAKVSAPKPKPVTSAPAPAPVLTGSGASAAKDINKMTTEERIAYWNAQSRGR